MKMVQQSRETKHKYSTYSLLVIFGLLIITYAIAGLDSKDLDEVCKIENAVLKRNSTGWDCRVTHQGELYYYDSNNNTINLASINNYTLIDTLNISNNVGMTLSNNNITINRTGNYDIDLSISFDGGANSEYEIAIFVDSTIQQDCTLHRKIGSGGDVGSASLGCIKTINNGSQLSVRVQDIDAPVQNINVHSMNLKVIEIS